MKILFVCLGNICRSPIAEGVMKSLISQNKLPWEVESASTNTFHTGEAPHKSSQKVCMEQGIDISKQRARRFNKNDLEHFDLIYAMAHDVVLEMKELTGSDFNDEKVTLFLNEMFPNENRSVTDPWYGDESGYYPVFKEIKQCCEIILQKYK